MDIDEECMEIEILDEGIINGIEKFCNGLIIRGNGLERGIWME